MLALPKEAFIRENESISPQRYFWKSLNLSENDILWIIARLIVFIRVRLMCARIYARNMYWLITKAFVWFSLRKRWRVFQVYRNAKIPMDDYYRYVITFVIVLKYDWGVFKKGTPPELYDARREDWSILLDLDYIGNKVSSRGLIPIKFSIYFIPYRIHANCIRE